jgi:D-alanyl-D-alanine carboxypeptidase/D-alanyl-D-alanine-endopeptidase (penicillin-binding protein 4)
MAAAPYNIILITLLTVLICGNAPAAKDIEKNCRSVLKHGSFKHAQYALSVKSCSSGREIVTINTQKSMVPASNIKLITAYCALEILGPDFKIKTKLLYNGKITDSVLEGDIIIKGGGDPTLGSTRIRDNPDMEGLARTWHQAMEKAGIKSVSGDIIGDDSYLDDNRLCDHTVWQDMGNYYASVTSGLCVHENMYILRLQPGDSVGDSVKVLGTVPHKTGITEFINKLSTGPKSSGDNAYIYGSPLSGMRILRGTVPAARPEFRIKGSLPDPAGALARFFKDYLDEKGITVKGGAYSYYGHNKKQVKPKKNNDSLISLYDHPSPPLSRIIKHMNRRSINIFADQLLKIMGKAETDTGSWEHGIRAEIKTLAKNHIATGGISIKDGCGLSFENRMTADCMTSVLATAGKSKNFKYFLESLSVSGKSGLLRNRFASKKLKGKIMAKTGTLDGVYALSGYLAPDGKNYLAFCFIANNFSGSRKAMHNKFRKIAEILVSG